MGQVRTLGLATAIKGTPTPAVLAAAGFTATTNTNGTAVANPGVVLASASFSITKGIATVVLTAALPTDGFNGPNGYIAPQTASAASATQQFNAQSISVVNIQGNFPAANGQQVTLWGFTTATYFNGMRVTVLDNNPATKSFRFLFAHADVASTADTTGFAAPDPKSRYRAIRLECYQSLSTDLIYVGDFNVAATRYMACLSLTGQLSIEVAGDNIPPEGIFIDTNGTASTDQVMVTLIY